MNPKVRIMLEDLLELYSCQSTDEVTAWDRMLEFLATDSRATLCCEFNHRFVWLYDNELLTRKTIQIYDRKLLSSDFYDHLGNIYVERILPQLPYQINEYSPMSHRQAELQAESMIPNPNEKKSILVPYAGTGRLIMAIHQRSPKSAIYGFERDLRLYRIALTNMCIHSVNATILHADPDKHELDISTPNGRANWQLSNKWNPNVQELKSETPVL